MAKLADKIRPLCEDFAQRIVAAVYEHMRQELGVGALPETVVPSPPSPPSPPQEPEPDPEARPCRVPGCKRPSKGPRYDFFCVEHRKLDPAVREAYKLRAMSPPQIPTAAPPKRRKASR